MKKVKKMKNLFRIFSISLLLLLSQKSYADVNSDLSNYFNGLGFDTNATSPNVYQGQQAGYYTGGSLFVRTSNRNVQIADIQLPSYRSGCGGIDLFSGGFSFINASNLVNELKNIMGNAQGYAFNLALESVTPEIANAMKYMNSLASSVNQMNINSCETAAGLVGSVWPKTHEAQQQVCEDVGTSKGIFSDYAAAHQGCGAGGQLATTLNSANGPYANQTFQNTNVAWQALQQNTFLQSDTQLAQFFMSLSGTIIMLNSGGDSGGNQFKVLPSLASNEQLLNALLHGGQVSAYVCDSTNNNGCLNPTLQSVTIDTNNALETQVTTMLNDMVDKIYTDQPLTQAEIGLLNATRLPLYKMLNVQAAFTGDKAALDVSDYADVIATDILFQYLDENLDVIRASSATLQYPDNIVQQFQTGIDQARQAVRQAEQSAYQQVSMSAQLIAQTQNIEQMLAGTLSSQLSSTLQWANSIKS